MAYENLTQMYDHILDPVRGWWDERQLSKVLSVSSTNDTQLYAGMCGHLDSSGEFLAGIPDSSATVLPLFLRNSWNASSATGTTDNDVRAVSGNISGGSGAPTGEVPDAGVSCLVGTGGYELATTEYDGTFTVGDPVSAVAFTSADADSGKITQTGSGTAYDALGEKTYVGVCTKDISDNYRGTSMVTFVTHLFQVTA
tara:strand:- start:1320 stop:1913 length:594 start_codon:yes stop_codon:yes gene_type:complete